MGIFALTHCQRSRLLRAKEHRPSPNRWAPLWGRGQPRDRGDSGGHGQACCPSLRAGGQQQTREQTQVQSLGSLLGHRPGLVSPGPFLPCWGSPCLSRGIKPHACWRSSLAPGCISRRRPRITSFLPVLIPAGDTQQVLLHLAARQHGSSAPTCASWAKSSSFPGGRGCTLEPSSPGVRVVRTLAGDGCHGSGHDFRFGLHWFAHCLKAVSPATAPFLSSLFLM